jgi:peptidoglycan/LPS O-acetylase OafA/YrhL
MNDEKQRLISTPFLPYLEGMRGCAALYVMLFHARMWLDRPLYTAFGAAGSILPFQGTFLLYGYNAVGIFIVISGFVLTLPLAARGTFDLGVHRFFLRRAKRLLPAYFAALTLATPLYVVALHQLGQATSPVHLVAQYLIHALMLQDLNPRVSFTIDRPMWSIALEVQIYILFAVLLLPILRRFGPAGFLAIAFALGLTPYVIDVLRHHHHEIVQIDSPWFLGLFALGSLAAYIAHDANDRYRPLRTAIPWNAVALVLGAAGVYLMLPNFGALLPQSPWPDICIGGGLAAVMIGASNAARAGRRAWITTMFEWKPLLVLGSFSYSLYLIHDPILWVATNTFADMSAGVRVGLMFGVFIPCIIGLAYVFYRCFELPYMSRDRKYAEAHLVSTLPPQERPALRT